jgi:hypothetical protein
VALAAVAAVSACGSSEASASKVAQAAGATTCEKSEWGIVSQLAGGKKTRIYNCNFADGSVKCVTYSNGVANDSTAVAHLVFATKLGSGHPSCLDG